jgi:hypothetical protein
LAATAAHAAIIDLYVLRIGDDQPGQISGDHKPYSIVQFAWDSANPGAVTPANTWFAPSIDPASRITMGNRSNEYGNLSLSADGNYLVFTGRNAPVNGVTGDTTHQIVASFSLQNHTFDTTTRVPYATTHFRSATTVDGTGFWTVGSTAGVEYVALGSSTATRVLDVTHNYRQINAYNNQLWFTRSAATTRGLYYMVYDGYPTSPEGSTDNLGWGRVNLAAAGSGGSGWDAANGGYNDFQFLNENTVFVTNNNNIEVFVRTDPQTNAFHKLVGANQGIGGWFDNTHLSLIELDASHVQLFFTQGTARFVDGVDNSALWTIVWNPETQTFVGDPVKLADSGLNYSFGGIALVPEPATIAAILGALAIALVMLRRRRR